DLARPVPLHRRGAHHEVWALRLCVVHGDDGLARLAEAHVVGEARAAPPRQERDALDLVREEPARDGLRTGQVIVPGSGMIREVYHGLLLSFPSRGRTWHLG